MAILYTGNGAHFEGAGSGLTIAVSLTGVVATNGIIGSVTWDTSATTTVSVSDGTTTANADKQRNSANLGQANAAWSIPNSPAGSRTFTATFGLASTSRGITATEFSGLPTAAGSFVTGTPASNDSGAGTATAFDNTISTTPAVAGALIFQIGEYQTQQPVVGGAFSVLENDANNDVTTGYFVQGAAAAVSPSFTGGAAQIWAVVIVAYAPAAGGVVTADDRNPQRATSRPTTAARLPFAIETPPAPFTPRALLEPYRPWVPVQPAIAPRSRTAGLETPPGPFTPRGLLEEPRRILRPSDRPATPPRAAFAIETPPAPFTPRGLMEEPLAPRPGPIPIARRPIPSGDGPPLPAVVTPALGDERPPISPRPRPIVTQRQAPQSDAPLLGTAPFAVVDSPAPAPIRWLRALFAPFRDDGAAPLTVAAPALPDSRFQPRAAAAAGAPRLAGDIGAPLPQAAALAWPDTRRAPLPSSRPGAPTRTPASDGNPFPALTAPNPIAPRASRSFALLRPFGDDGWLQLFVVTTLKRAIAKDLQANSLSRQDTSDVDIDRQDTTGTSIRRQAPL